MNGGFTDQDQLLSQLVRLGAQQLAQETLEQEATDDLGWEHYEHFQEGQEHLGYRNGYRPAGLDTAEGRVKLQIPQLRESPDPYSSKLMKFLPEGHRDCVRGNRDVLERLAIEMYTRGLSTRDIKGAFREVTGDMLLSRTAVSNLIDQLLDHRSFFSDFHQYDQASVFIRTLVL